MNQIITNQKEDGKAIDHIMKKYKLGAVDATCIYYDIISILINYHRGNAKK